MAIRRTKKKVERELGGGSSEACLSFGEKSNTILVLCVKWISFSK
jgi:hypothetical protein